MAREDVPVEIRSYEEARNILNNFTTNGEWLKNLVWKYSWQYTGRTMRDRWPIKYSDLIRYGNRIKGIAQKVMKSRPEYKVLERALQEEHGLAMAIEADRALPQDQRKTEESDLSDLQDTNSRIFEHASNLDLRLLSEQLGSEIGPSVMGSLYRP